MFIDTWLEKWSSSRVDVKISVKTFHDHNEVTVIFYHDTLDNTLCTAQFNICTEFNYRCFERSMEGFICAFYKNYHEQVRGLNNEVGMCMMMNPF